LIAFIGVLVQCDESIKAIIEKLDKENNNAYILESLDDQTMLVASGKINELKAQLKAVRYHHQYLLLLRLTRCSSLLTISKNKKNQALNEHRRVKDNHLATINIFRYHSSQLYQHHVRTIGYPQPGLLPLVWEAKPLFVV
jgi:TFIIH basal transcription factor complex TTD-A subunit